LPLIADRVGNQVEVRRRVNIECGTPPAGIGPLFVSDREAIESLTSIPPRGMMVGEFCLGVKPAVTDSGPPSEIAPFTTNASYRLTNHK
jgi:hypothetical protein